MCCEWGKEIKTYENVLPACGLQNTSVVYLCFACKILKALNYCWCLVLFQKYIQQQL